MDRDDALLVQRAQTGDQDALVEIYRRFQPSIYTYVFYRTGDQALAEDITADVFVRMVGKLHTFVPQGRPVLAWLYTIAHHLVIDHYRCTGNLSTLPLEESLVADASDQPAQIVENHFSQQRLVKALDQLTEEQRQVILLKFVEERSNMEVAAVLGKTEGAVKSLQHRALAALHRAMNGEPHEI